VGTHDERFVPVVTPSLGIGAGIEPDLLPGVLEMARQEVAMGAARVKAGGPATRHPIVEGIVRVCEAIAYDRRALLTVSVLDPSTPEGLFYSVPCTIGAAGVLERHTELLREPAVEAGLEVCRAGLRNMLRAAGED
jgi:malate/lactate dehydrogenase